MKVKLKEITMNDARDLVTKYIETHDTQTDPVLRTMTDVIVGQIRRQYIFPSERLLNQAGVKVKTETVRTKHYYLEEPQGEATQS